MPAPLTDGPLLLRPFADADAPAFAAAVLESQDSLSRWMPWAHAGYSPAEALAWFARCRQAALDGSACEFGLFDVDSGQLLGGAGLNQFNRAAQQCNLGYWVRLSAQRQGVATRAARRLARLGLHQLGLNRVEINAAVGNEASAAVARRAGAVAEGVARCRIPWGAGALHAQVFSFTHAELPWPEARANQASLAAAVRRLVPHPAPAREPTHAAPPSAAAVEDHSGTPPPAQ